MSQSDSEIIFNALKIMPRTYDYIRQMAIQNVYDAIPELITNAVDAYNRMQNPPDIRKINITIKLPSTIIVQDYAIGFSADEMRKSLLQVGNYTADDSSRGMMGRGAKDITILGDITYESIKNGYYSKCLLKQDATGAILIDHQEATSDIRNKLNTPQGNTTKVVMKMLSRYQLDNPEIIKRLIVNDYELRDIFTNDKIKAHIDIYKDNELIIDEDLNYEYPEGKRIFNMTYDVEGYDGVEAHFELYKTKTVIPPPRMIRDNQNGVMVSSDVTIYQCNFLGIDYTFNPANTKHIYGRLHCNHLHRLLLDLNENGPTEDNPYTVLDPSRRQGLNVMHPFVNALFKPAKSWLTLILSNLNDIREDSYNVEEDLQNIMDILQDIGRDLLSNTLFDSWRRSRNTDLITKSIDQIVNIEVDQDDVRLDSDIIEQLNEQDFTGFDDIPDNMTSNFKIVFTDDVTLPYKYSFYTANGYAILKVNVSSTSLEPYFTNVNGVIEQNSATYELSTMVILGIITECFGRLTGKKDFVNRQLPIAVFEASDLHDKVFEIFEENATLVESQFYQTAYEYIFNKIHQG